MTDQQGLRNDGHQQPWVKNTEVVRFLFDMDNTAPTVSISGNHNGFVSDYNSWKDARNVMVTVEDTNLGETSLHRASDSIVKTYTNEGTEFSIGIGLPEGVYYLVHTDEAGNESARVHFTISNKGPAIYDIEGLSPDSTTIVGPDGITAQFKVGNGDSLAATVDQVMVRGWVYDSSKPSNRGAAAFSNQEIDTSTGTYDIDLAALLGDKFVHGAKFIIMLQARNTANVHDQQTFILEVDLQAPVVTINSYAQPFTTGTPMIEGTVDDTAASVEVSLDDGVNWTATAYTPRETTWSFTYLPSLALANGNYTILARATDEHGNRTEGQALATRTFAVLVATAADNPVENIATNSPSTPTNRTTPVNNNSNLLANFTPAPVVNSPVADTTDETGDVAGAATANKDSEDKGQVLAAEDAKDSWSLINLLLTIGIGVASIISLLGLLGANRKDRKLASRLLTIVPAAGAVVALLLIEDFSGSMIWVNIWSLLIGALAVIQMIILGMSKPTTNE